jgi:ribose transport system substrate-binding protein
MRRISSLVALVAAVGATLVISACGSDDSKKSAADQPAGKPQAAAKLKIACIPKSTENEFWLATKAGCERAAKQAGVELVFGAAETESDIQGEISEVEDALAKGVDALAIAPSAPDQLQPVLERAAKEVPVLLLDTDIPNMNGKTAYIGTDNLKAGKISGQYVVEQAKKGKFGILTGDPGVTSVEERVKGIKEAVKGTDIQIVTVLNVAGCAKDKGVSATEDMLTAHPDLDGIIAACGNPLLGGLQAIKQAGKKPEDMFLMSFDALPESTKLVGEGVLDGDIAQFPGKFGELGITEGIKAAEGKPVAKVIDSGVEVVTKENAAQFKTFQ